MPNATTNEKEIKALQAQVSELAAQLSETNSLIRSLLDGQGVQTQLIRDIDTASVQLPQTKAKSANRELPPALEAVNLQCDPKTLGFKATEDGQTIADFRGKPQGAMWRTCFVNHNKQDNTEAVSLLQQVKELNINPTDLVVSAEPDWKKSNRGEWEVVYYVSNLSVIASKAPEPDEQLPLSTVSA